MAAHAESWYQDRAWQLLRDAQDGDPELRRRAAVAVEPLLTAARSAEPAVLARVLRVAALVRDRAPQPAQPADAALDELVELATRHGMVGFEAGAHALRGQIALGRGRTDAALESAASALCALDTAPSSYQRGLALTDVAILLVHLGLEDTAEPLLARAHEDITAYGRPRHQLLSATNRVHTAVVHGLCLERAARPADAAERYRDAARWAADCLRRHWSAAAHDADTDTDSGTDVGQGTRAGPAGDPAIGRLGAEYTAELHAALALADVAGVGTGPDDTRVDALRDLLPRLRRPDRRLIAGIALSRSLSAAGDRAGALRVLAELATTAPDRDVERQLQLAAVREVAELRVGLQPDGGPVDPLRSYLAQVETELWALRRSRAEALASRLAHERLRREHVQLSAQAAQDPLTGLANRRALQQVLSTVLAPGGTRSAVVVALLDLDGLKRVNDAGSHADGDDVLRSVAAAMVATVRAEDLVARYGGDEFVAVIPETAGWEGLTAVQRLVDAVAAVPIERGFGVTVSAGAVVVPTGAMVEPARVLSAADAAMYRAKQAGGNRVFADPG